LRYAPGVYLACALRARSLASVLRTRFNDLGRPTNKGQVLQTGTTQHTFQDSTARAVLSVTRIDQLVVPWAQETKNGGLFLTGSIDRNLRSLPSTVRYVHQVYPSRSGLTLPWPTAAVNTVSTQRVRRVHAANRCPLKTLGGRGNRQVAYLVVWRGGAAGVFIGACPVRMGLPHFGPHTTSCSPCSLAPSPASSTSSTSTTRPASAASLASRPTTCPTRPSATTSCRRWQA
jgi:hypothetical protein